MTNSSKFLVTIVKFKILFNFSLRVLRFTQRTRKGNTTQNTLRGKDLNLMFLISFFRKISPNFEISLKL